MGQLIVGASADTFLDDDNNSANYSTEAELRTCISTAPGVEKWKSLLIFDFSVLPTLSSVDSIIAASLSLYRFIGSTRPITVSQIVRTNIVIAQATWDIYKTGSNWTFAGCSHTTSDFTTVDQVELSVGQNGWHTWDILNLIKYAYTNYSKISRLLLSDTGNSFGVKTAFYSKEYATDTSLRPKLTIDYTDPESGASPMMFLGF